MIADGVTFSFGVFFDKLEEEFGESKAVTAGVVSLFHAVPLLSGPVASALTDRWDIFFLFPGDLDIKLVEILVTASFWLVWFFKNVHNG